VEPVKRQEVLMSRAIVACLIATAAVLTAPLPARAGAERPTVADAAQCNEEARRRAGRPPGPAVTLTPEPKTRTDQSGSIVAESADPLLEGMAAAGLDNAGYRSVYRACVAARARRAR
jgi:hypothetical protein